VTPQDAVTTQDAGSASPGDSRVSAAEPALPEQSREDTDEGWGEYPARDDDWLKRDRPPHWADF
jgi:hypothetical protein